MKEEKIFHEADFMLDFYQNPIIPKRLPEGAFVMGG
jgi:hypothetical protein